MQRDDGTLHPPANIGDNACGGDMPSELARWQPVPPDVQHSSYPGHPEAQAEHQNQSTKALVTSSVVSRQVTMKLNMQ